MKILVIGGSGFIGKPLIRELQRQGHAITLFQRGNNALPAELTSNGLDQIEGDRKNLRHYREQLLRCQAEIVVDMILSSERQAAELISIFASQAARVVALSSIDVYRACGLLHGTESGPLQPLPLTEDSTLRSQPAYPTSVLRTLRNLFGWLDEDYDKVQVEQVVMSDARLPGTILRLPMIYGPGDYLHRCFPIIKRINDGRSKILFAEDYAAWRAPRGYVENVVTAILLAINNPIASGRIYNVAEEHCFSELEWTEGITKLLGWNGQFIILPREKVPKSLMLPGNFAQHWLVSTERIRTELGYCENVPLTTALRTTLNWESANPPEQIDQEKFDYRAEDNAIDAVANRSGSAELL